MTLQKKFFSRNRKQSVVLLFIFARKAIRERVGTTCGGAPFVAQIIFGLIIVSAASGTRDRSKLLSPLCGQVARPKCRARDSTQPDPAKRICSSPKGLLILHLTRQPSSWFCCHKHRQRMSPRWCCHSRHAPGRQRIGSIFRSARASAVLFRRFEMPILYASRSFLPRADRRRPNPARCMSTSTADKASPDYPAGRCSPFDLAREYRREVERGSGASVGKGEALADPGRNPSKKYPL